VSTRLTARFEAHGESALIGRNDELVKNENDVTPSASRLTTSLRDIGYDFSTAVADLIDNSISAQASRVEIVIESSGHRSWILISDDGTGMSRREVTESLRFGSRRDYSPSDLGRFGLGLKTASLSQAKRVTVVSRRAVTNRTMSARTLDLDHISRLDAWQVYEPDGDTEPLQVARSFIADAPGTVIVLEKLDRVFGDVDPASGWGRRRLEKLAQGLADYLGMVFHRFLEGTADRDRPLTILVNGEKIRPWSPFGSDEPETQRLPARRFSLTDEGGVNRSVTFEPFVLPSRSRFSSMDEFDRLSGPKKWNRQQGIYFYRSDRMVQSGSWAGLRSIDEHTKFARASLNFPTALDEHFRVNVAKMRAQIPTSLREMLVKPVNELCAVADASYRRASLVERRNTTPRQTGTPSSGLKSAGVSLRVAAAIAGATRSLEDIAAVLRDSDPEVAEALGFNE
jgi:hypothetical protein